MKYEHPTFEVVEMETDVITTSDYIIPDIDNDIPVGDDDNI